MLLDLDHFKDLNDTLGHPAGDLLLHTAAERLSAAVRPADTLARLGGTRRALLVCGQDGLDEVTLAAPTRVREVCGDHVAAWEWTPDDFGLPPCSLADLATVGLAVSAMSSTAPSGPPSACTSRCTTDCADRCPSPTAA